LVSIFFFFLGFTRSFYTQSLCNISATELAMAWVALLVLGDLVCMQRKAQLFAPNRGGQLVSGFGFHSSVHQDWAVANILMTAGLLHSEPDAGAKPLVYVELATNDALLGSNTAFFDRCLGWCPNL
jgi:hypothetical protein